MLCYAKSLQSCLTLCDSIDSNPPGSPSLRFSRQEHWSGLPFPSPMHESGKVKVKLLSRVWLLVTPWTAAHQAPPSMGFKLEQILTDRSKSTNTLCKTRTNTKFEKSHVLPWVSLSPESLTAPSPPCVTLCLFCPQCFKRRKTSACTSVLRARLP